MFFYWLWSCFTTSCGSSVFHSLHHLLALKTYMCVCPWMHANHFFFLLTEVKIIFIIMEARDTQGWWWLCFSLIFLYSTIGEWEGKQVDAYGLEPLRMGMIDAVFKLVGKGVKTVHWECMILLEWTMIICIVGEEIDATYIMLCIHRNVRWSIGISCRIFHS